MKKLKEFLCLIIPFLLISALHIILQIYNFNFYYLKLLIKNPRILVMIFNTYLPPILIGLSAVGIFTLIRYTTRGKVNITRKIYYISSISIGGIFSLISIILPPIIINHTPVLTAVNSGTLLMALKIGFLIALLFWIAEFIFCKIKGKNQ